MLAKRRSALAGATEPTEIVHRLRSFIADFGDLADVSAESDRLDRLSGEPAVGKAITREREADDAESRVLEQTFELEAALGENDRRDASLMLLGARLRDWSRTAGGDSDTPERRRARRLLRSVLAGAADRVHDPEYLALLEPYRRQARGW